MEQITGQQEFFADDGKFPNNILPVIIYRNVFNPDEKNLAVRFEQLFESNNWTNSWRDGIFTYHHYHSTTHEVMGVYKGSVKLHVGGEQGKILSLEKGDVIIIPAGVAHKNVHAEDLGVVGAYPEGRQWDTLTGEPGERPAADESISLLPHPDKDPVYGEGGITESWNEKSVARMM